MFTLRPEWLLVGGILSACESPDLAETGKGPPNKLCTKVYAPSGFGITFAVDTTTASGLDEATVSVCRAGDHCHTKAIYAQVDFWFCDESPYEFSCSAYEQDGVFFISTFVDVYADLNSRPLENGDVWRGALTDAQGQVVLSHSQAVDYVAICINGSPECGVDYQATVCVSNDEVVCPDTDTFRLCPENVGLE